MKRAIIYYSLSENTKNVAEKIASETGADIYRIDFVKPLPNNKAMQMVEGGRQATFGVKPEIKGVPEDVSQYDEIIIGTPIWAGKSASPINTLLDNDGICNKSVAVFTLSGGGDNAGCIKQLKQKMQNIRCEIALADSKTNAASENDNRIKDFISKL